jgi:hypothetical protein
MAWANNTLPTIGIFIAGKSKCVKSLVQATYTTAHVGGAWSLSRKSSSQHFSAAATANSIIMQSESFAKKIDGE